MSFIPKSYYHKKTVLALLALNIAMLIIALIFTISGVDSENPRAVIQYRASLSDSITRDSTNYLYNFSVFAFLITVISIILSVRLYTHRHRLSAAILGGNFLILILTIVVFNALSGVQ